MSGFLQKIHAITQERVAAAQAKAPVSALQNNGHYSRTPQPVLPAFQKDGYNVIAEVKFASPSEGDIKTTHDYTNIAAGYLANGAAMLSVLTEPQYFKGSLDYLSSIRAKNPDALLLRKDFICDTYQLHEARAAGADTVLLIVAMTGAEKTAVLYHEAAALGLTPLIEVHDGAELDIAQDMGARLIGVNNRNLKTLKIDLQTGLDLAAKKRADDIFICESGLSTPQDLKTMRDAGYDGFLIGSHFMRQPDPGAALKDMLEGACA
ncbi:MAG: indole-3-glycerol phosphate synthase TrpC [Alphaproteobacteria bacterium]|nr:indole-3-glycerol phosphate synthase TrpC [Alphaproteobacteria bacterium]